MRFDSLKNAEIIKLVGNMEEYESEKKGIKRMYDEFRAEKDRSHLGLDEIWVQDSFSSLGRSHRLEAKLFYLQP